jgi:hypothetical protein
VYIDGGSNPVPVSPEQATQALQDLQNGTPWLAFGGIPAPFLGLFSATGSTAAGHRPQRRVAGAVVPVAAGQPAQAGGMAPA